MVRVTDGQRRTKKDLKRKRIARGYKRGGQFRTMNVSELGGSEEECSSKEKKSKGKNQKRY
jgi:hypothetical protein